MRRELVLACLILGLCGAAVATGAVVLTDDDRTDRIDDDLVAAPHSGPNGDYAYVSDETNELGIDLTAKNEQIDGEGINPGSYYRIDDVFTLTYSGEKYAKVWLEHDADNVSFYTNQGSIEGKSNATTLGPDDSIAVGFSVDTRDRDSIEPLIDSIEIHAKLPDETDQKTPPPGVSPCPPGASIEVTAPDKVTRSVSLTDVQTCEPESIALKSLQIGERATLESATVQFATDDDASFTVVADHDRKKSKPAADLRAETGSAPIGAFTVEDAPDDEAIDEVTYHVDVDRKWLDREGIDPEAVTGYERDGTKWTEADLEMVEHSDRTVRYAVTTDRVASIALGVAVPDLVVEEVAVEPKSIDAGQSATVTAIVRNDRPVAADLDLSVLVDDERFDDKGDENGVGDESIATESRTVPANESIDVELEREFDDPGTYDVALGYEYTAVGGDEFAASDGVIDAGDLDVAALEPDEPARVGDRDGAVESAETEDADGLGSTIPIVLGGLGALTAGLWALRTRS